MDAHEKGDERKGAFMGTAVRDAAGIRSPGRRAARIHIYRGGRERNRDAMERGRGARNKFESTLDRIN